jgi:NADH-quinone oxidoreductase subunit L
MMWAGSLALAGVFPFAGFYSKDAILEDAWASHTAIGQYGFWCTLIAAFLTGFYSWRLLIMTFHGKPRADQRTLEHVHESPPVMTVPLILLAIGALTTGFIFHNQLIGAGWHAFWGNSIEIAAGNHVLEEMDRDPQWVVLAPSVLGLLGIGVAYLFYMVAPGIPGWLAARFGGVYRLLLNKWYVDELYDAVFVRPTLALARTLWHRRHSQRRRRPGRGRRGPGGEDADRLDGGVRLRDADRSGVPGRHLSDFPPVIP